MECSSFFNNLRTLTTSRTAVLEREDTKTSEELAVENTLKNQLHTAAVVDGAHSYAPETGTPVNQLYTQVDKKKKKRKGKEVCEDFP